MKLRGLIGFVFLVLVVGSPAFAQGVHGVFTVVKGDIQVESGKDKKVQKARVGAKVFATDTITSGKDSRAKIEMSDKNIINISPDSKLMIEKYENAGGKKEVLLNVLQGKIRPSVTQTYNGESEKFHVKTPSAVAGVRGTDFLVSYNPGTRASQVVTFEGKVDVGAKLDVGGRIANPVSVLPGQFTTSSATQPPAPPAPMPQEQLKQMNRESSADPSQSAGAPQAAGPTANAEKSDKKEDGAKDKPDANADAKADTKADAKDAKADAKGDPKPDGKADVKADAKPDAKGGDKPAPSADKGPAPKEGGPAKPEARSPAAVSTGGAGPNMRPTSEDLGNRGPANEPPRMPTMPDMPTMPVIAAPRQFVNPDIIQNNGNSKVLIRISSPSN
ncbi:MAG: FecR domain-containing protein [Bdellovibrionales bacterium]|nr:FecR domain-containing protein [Bdellovibrionales bacterium]